MKAFPLRQQWIHEFCSLIRFDFVCQYLTLSVSFYYCPSDGLWACLSVFVLVYLSVWIHEFCFLLRYAFDSQCQRYIFCLDLSLSVWLSVVLSVCLSICLSVLVLSYSTHVGFRRLKPEMIIFEPPNLKEARILFISYHSYSPTAFFFWKYPKLWSVITNLINQDKWKTWENRYFSNVFTNNKYRNGTRMRLIDEKCLDASWIQRRQWWWWWW